MVWQQPDCSIWMNTKRSSGFGQQNLVWLPRRWVVNILSMRESRPIQAYPLLSVGPVMNHNGVELHEQMGSRADDIERLYGSGSWEEAKAILDQYNIRYVYIGSLELAKYQVNEMKFSGVLRLAFQSGRVVIYEYDPIK